MSKFAATGQSGSPGAEDLAGLAAMTGLPGASSLPQVGVRPDGAVIFTLPRRFRWPLIQRGSILAAVTAAAFLPVFRLTFLAVLAWFTGPCAFGYLVAYFWRGRFATVVSTEAITIRGYLTRVVPWTQVTSIDVVAYGPATPYGFRYRHGDRRRGGLVATSGKMARLAAAFVVSGNGRKVMLRAPLVTNWQHDPYFDQKIELIRALMKLYAGVR